MKIIKAIRKPEKDEVEIGEMKTKLNSLEETNNKIAIAKKTVRDNEDWSLTNEKYNNLSGRIKEIDERKKKKLLEVKMPIEGLGWDEENVIYNNLPFNQISGAEQLKISMAIAMASNPKLKVVLIKDGSLLDQDSLKVIEEMAKEKDWQIWIESVDESGKIGIYIEDGEIKSIN